MLQNNLEIALKPHETMSPPKCFLLLIGLPGAGKSTFAKGIADNVEKDDGADTAVVVVSYDELIPLGTQVFPFSVLQTSQELDTLVMYSLVCWALNVSSFQCFKLNHI